MTDQVRRRLPVQLLRLFLMPGAIAPAAAQSPPADSIKVPQWVPADSVNPSIEVVTRLDSGSGSWRYVYRITNQPPATQALTKLGLLLEVTVDSVKAPAGWWAVVYNPPAMLPGVTFAARQQPDGSWPKAVQPGGPAVVLEVFSRAPPGRVAYYARGSAPAMMIERVEPAMAARLPSEQEDARRGETVGPVSPARRRGAKPFPR